MVWHVRCTRHSYQHILAWLDRFPLHLLLVSTCSYGLIWIRYPLYLLQLLSVHYRQLRDLCGECSGKSHANPICCCWRHGRGGDSNVFQSGSASDTVYFRSHKHSDGTCTVSVLHLRDENPCDEQVYHLMMIGEFHVVFCTWMSIWTRRAGFDTWIASQALAFWIWMQRLHWCSTGWWTGKYK